MDLYLHESILLLSIDDENGKFTSSYAYLNYGFAGALLMDLVLDGRLTIEEKRVILKGSAVHSNKPLNTVLDLIKKSKRNKKFTSWIYTLVQKNSSIMKMSLEELIRKNILKRQSKKVLWVFNVKRYPTINLEPEQSLRRRLHDILFNEAEPNEKESILLGLIYSCKMVNELVPDKKARKVAQERIKVLTEGHAFKDLIKQALEEMETAITAVTTATTYG